MNNKHLIKATAVLILSAVDSAAFAQQTATFTNPVTCTTGACRAGHLATRIRSGVYCSAYGTYRVTISFNGETKTATASCAGDATYCSGQSMVSVGGRQFALEIYADAERRGGTTTLPIEDLPGSGHGTNVSYDECENVAEGY